MKEKWVWQIIYNMLASVAKNFHTNMFDLDYVCDSTTVAKQMY